MARRSGSRRLGRRRWADGRPSGIGTHLWRAYEYNGGGLQSAEIDANGNRTTQLYEGLGRAIVTVHADGAETWTIRNQRGQVLIGKTRGGDFQTTYHDALGRVQAIIEGGQVDGRWSRTGYDLSGRTVWKDVSNQPGPSWNESLRRDIHVYHYDAAGRVRADDWQPSDVSAGSATFTTTYGYDAAGNRTSIAWPDGFTATYGFDAANRPANVSFGDNHAAMAYDGLGRRRSLGRSTGVATTWAYEVDGDLASIVHPFWNGGVTLSYGHDAAGRTTSVGTSDGRFEWMPSIGYGRSYGVANGLNQATSMGGTGLSWTPNGNLAGDGTNTYHWTWGNRLAGISRPGTSATYAYDAEDRRSMKIVDGVMTRTLWSGADELAQMGADGTVLRRFVPDGSGAMDGRLATLEANGTVYWHHVDHQGSVIATSNAAGLVVSVANYSPHGELGTATDGTPLTAPPTGSPFGYTGRTYDPESGLWQYRARYYHPKVGSFLSQDPIGTRDDPNLYMYVGLDPVNRTDPTGEQCVATSGRCNVSDNRSENVRRQNPGLAGRIAARYESVYGWARRNPEAQISVSANINRGGQRWAQENTKTTGHQVAAALENTAISVDNVSMTRVVGTNRFQVAPGNNATTSDDTMGGRTRQDTSHRFATSYGAANSDNMRIVGHEIARTIPAFTDSIDRSWPRSNEGVQAADDFSAALQRKLSQ